MRRGLQFIRHCMEDAESLGHERRQQLRGEQHGTLVTFWRKAEEAQQEDTQRRDEQGHGWRDDHRCPIQGHHIHVCRFQRAVAGRPTGVDRAFPAFPQLNVTRNNISTTLITAQDQATHDTLSSMTVLGEKPIKFNLLGDQRKISTGIVQRVPVIVPTALLLVTQSITEATRITVWDPIEKTAVPTRSIKITWEGSTMADIIMIGYLGNFSVRPYTPVRCYQCQKYGHTSRKCHAQLSTCGICSKRHTTSECVEKRKTETIIVKCCNCKRQHVTALSACPVRRSKLRSFSRREWHHPRPL